MKAINLILFILLLSTTGCYTFKGYSIDQELETFAVANFRDNTTNAPPTINQTFSESLKEKVNRESRLKFNDVDPDILFAGSINSFLVTAVAPQPGETTAFNRLEIRVFIDYKDSLNEENNWESNFSHFQDFPSNQNLLGVQDELIDAIFDQIIEDIFNKAFTNW